MTILVTGSAGHLGEALMRTLRSAARPARGIDIKASDYTNQVGSISDSRFVASCMDGVTGVIHAATLHKPHVATHSYQDFLETNVKGTLMLLQAAFAACARSFVFTSTTSAFGSALSAAADQSAAWITEDVTPVAKNIYGVTKLAAEGICELFAHKHRLPVVVLRTSRFFPEEDDDAEVRGRYSLDNAQANELLYRRADIEDVVSAHLLALEKAPALGFGRFIISATTPFARDDVPDLRRDAPSVVGRLFPEFGAVFAAKGWSMFPSFDRVYVNAHARKTLGWKPRYDFAHVLECLARERDFRSQLSGEIGAKGYHAERFDQGPYPVS